MQMTEELERLKSLQDVLAEKYEIEDRPYLLTLKKEDL